VKRLDAPAVEERLAQLVHPGKREGDFLVRNHVTVKVEANTQVLSQPVRAVECADRITTGNHQDRPVLEQRVPQEVLLGPEILNAHG